MTISCARPSYAKIGVLPETVGSCGKTLRRASNIAYA